MSKRADETIKHQIRLRGQFTRIAKQSVLHLEALKRSVKAEIDEAMEAKNWMASAKLRKTFATIDKLIDEQYSMMSDTLKVELGDLFAYETEFSSKLLSVDFDTALISEKLVRSVVEQE